MFVGGGVRRGIGRWMKSGGRRLRLVCTGEPPVILSCDALWANDYGAGGRNAGNELFRLRTDRNQSTRDDKADIAEADDPTIIEYSRCAVSSLPNRSLDLHLTTH